MSRTVSLALAMALFLSACIAGLPLPGLTIGNPSLDAQASEAALASTLVIETLNAPLAATQPPAEMPVLTATLTTTPLPTLTLSPTPTDTATVSGVPATGTVTSTATETATETVTDTVTSTATLATASLLPTGMPASGTPASPTATETLHPRFYGT